MAARGAGRGVRDDVADLTGPIRLRRERAVRRQRRRLLVTLVVGVLAVAVFWTLAFSPLFATRTCTLAPVREVQVTRSWPHTMDIRVSERTPAVAFAVNGGYMLVDSEGVGYAEVPELPEGLLQAQGDAADPGVTAAVGRTLGTLPAEVRDRVRGVRATSAAEVVLELDEGRAVVWGGPEQPELKSEVLAVLLEHLPETEVYDVSAPAFPTTR